jgi:hypothetical protein
MNRRFLAILPAALMIAPPGSGQGQQSAANRKIVPARRTRDGHPDLQGIWTNATITPLQRPSALANKPTLTDTEAAEFEKNAAKDLKDVDGKSVSPLLAEFGANGTGGYNVLFVDRGTELARVDGQKRTSLIIDPPNGKIPPITPAARKRNAEIIRSYLTFNTVKDRPLSERCLVGFGSTSGPPMLPVLYNNNYQIVQTPDAIMILVEMVHDVRVIRMNATHLPSNIRQWLGDSIGHWEGDTLVVDTTNFTDQTKFEGSSPDLHVIERFQRIDANTMLYRATIDDPSTFTQIWTIEYPFRSAPGPVYEYACHEGNYAMTDIMGGARRTEAASGKK